jgi:hypothetical protein
MRLHITLLFVVFLCGCESLTPRSAPDNSIAQNFVATPKGALIVLIPPPQSEGLELGERMMGAQLFTQLKKSGYRVATLQRKNFEELWSQEAAAVGGVFDPVSGAIRPQASATAMASLALRVCEEAKCSLLVRQRLVIRNAELDGQKAEWDGVRQSIPTTNVNNSEDHRFSGSTPALSVELLAITSKGEFAFRSYGGATLPYETNFRESKTQLRKNIFKSDKEIAEGVRVALLPLISGGLNK